MKSITRRIARVVMAHTGFFWAIMTMMAQTTMPFSRLRKTNLAMRPTVPEKNEMSRARNDGLYPVVSE
jgi:hypothetical protein